MNLANPWGLLGLLSLPVILALHMLRERRRRYIVSDLRLWEFMRTEARQVRPRRVPVTLLLLLDLLAGLLLALALAQPRLDVSIFQPRSRHAVLLLDVSSSMRARLGSATRFEQARSEVLSLLGSLGPEDTATVLAFGRRPRLVGDTRQTPLSELANRVAALQPGETGHTLAEAVALGQAALTAGLPAEFHIFTDGAFTAIDPQTLAHLPGPVTWRLAAGPDDNNQAVLALNVTPTGENRWEVFTRVVNYAGQPVARAISLIVDGRIVDQAPVEIGPDSTVAKVWTYAGQPAAISVALSGNDNLGEDDHATTGVLSRGQLRVALVAIEAEPLRQAIAAVPQAELEHIQPELWAAQSARTDFDLTIFRGFIPESWPAGQVLVVDPPVSRNVSAGPALEITGRVAIPVEAPLQAQADYPLLAGIDFSGVRWTRAHTLATLPFGFQTLLQAGETPLLVRGEVESASPVLPGAGPGSRASTPLLALLADLERGNFTRHPAFPILVANLIQNLRQGGLPVSLPAGEPVPLPPVGVYQAIRVTPPVGPGQTLAGAWAETWEATHLPGLYRFEYVGADGQAAPYVVGVNTGDPGESDLRLRSWARSLAAGQPVTPAGEPPAPAETPEIELAPWLLAAAILILLVEAILAWRSR